jgi:hypothetical protein
MPFLVVMACKHKPCEERSARSSRHISFCLEGNKSSRYLQLIEHVERCDLLSFIRLKTTVKNFLRSQPCFEREWLRSQATTEETQKPVEELSGLCFRDNIFFLPPRSFCRFGQSNNEFTMLLDWTTGPLAEGLLCYQNQEFFDAHEHWEAVWLRCNEPEKTFLQALIQVAAAFHHLKHGNPTGTGSLLRRALHRLDGFPAEYEGVAVAALRTNIGGWLDALGSEEAVLQLPFPRIR